MIKTFFSLMTVKLPIYYVYMLQQVEYEPKKFLDWFERLFRDSKTIQSTTSRKKIVYTPKAKLLIGASYLVVFLVLISIAALFRETPALIAINWFVLFMTLPFVLELFLVLVTTVGYFAVVKPQKTKLIARSRDIFTDTPARKIAVIGSYGKTTMKELLTTVLAEGFKVAATPGNMNVAVSHARFAVTLQGDEDIIIVEFGEGEPGDVAQMSQTISPDYAVITGLAPNHLDHYPDLGSIAKDLLSVYSFVDKDKVVATNESSMLSGYLPKSAHRYSTKEVMGWKITRIATSFQGISFIMKKGKNKLSITSGLLGRHQVAPIAYVAALAHDLGLSNEQIEIGCSKTVPFEHRMQPRNVHGAWIIDDTYNGNLEGLKAGLELLKELPASRKWYVTPGLVDQGSETDRVHSELGVAIASAAPDIVVLMKNSVTPTIIEAMKTKGFSGETRIEEEPLNFYLNIDQIIAKGDVVLMQNDWTDNYN